jgi:hypothetical protein
VTGDGQTFEKPPFTGPSDDEPKGKGKAKGKGKKAKE